MKREFLVENIKDIKTYLQENSLTCKLYKYEDKKSYMYEFVDCTYILEEYKSLCKLVLIGKKKLSINKIIKKLKDITNDKRYSRKYLTLFGNPKKYTFDVESVFSKCDSIGLAKMDLHFLGGMDSIKVFRVLLYRLNQLFLLQYEKFLNNNLEYEVLKNAHVKLKNTLKCSSGVFDKRIIKSIIKDLNDLYIILNHQDKIDRYKMNFQYFIEDESSFYEKNTNQKPIYFVVKKKIDNMLFLAEEKNRMMLNSKFLSREFVNIKQEIDCIMQNFSSVFGADELLEINLRVKELKKVSMR